MNKEAIQAAVFGLMEEFVELKAERADLLSVLARYTPLEIETDQLAKDLDLTPGEFKKWLCAGSIPFLKFRRGNGYTIHPYIEGKGYVQMKSRENENYFVWSLKGRIAILKEWDEWLTMHQKSDIDKLKR